MLFRSHKTNTYLPTRLESTNLTSSPSHWPIHVLSSHPPPPSRPQTFPSFTPPQQREATVSTTPDHYCITYIPNIPTPASTCLHPAPRTTKTPKQGTITSAPLPAAPHVLDQGLPSPPTSSPFPAVGEPLSTPAPAAQHSTQRRTRLHGPRHV